MKIANRVRVLERVIRQLVLAIAEDDSGETVDQATLLTELIESDDLAAAVARRGLWLEVKSLEEAEEDLRTQAAEAARARGIETARLVIMEPDEETPSTMILTMPSRTKAEEERIVKALHIGTMSVVGGLLIEHEIARTTLSGIIVGIGMMIPEATEPQLQRMASAMAKMDFEVLQDIIAPYFEAIQTQGSDVAH